ncbi:MAG: ferritin-like domain-containing protein [Candidatus Bathyarchaeota archaeon]|nr:ferritin-like domain-containing protein [Candidatus Bathyarchaeota archaeon]MDH5663575.1 ferritin-like domain-containing protein [Candidatus Bathyarchaeota archaeon]
MGKKGREIVGVDIKELLKDLNAAYADEWIAFFYYTWAADFIEGPDYPTVASELDRIAKDEFEHMSELADRIFELGGEPERDLEDLQKIANCTKVVFPKNERNLEGVLNAVAEAEGCAIDVYNKLLKKVSACYDKDVRTFHLIEHILSEEIQHEEAFENLLEKKRK